MLKRQVIAIGAAALMLLGCAEMSTPRAAQTATTATMTTATGTVTSIDQASRRIVLKDDADGSTFAVTAGPEVRNLGEVKAGDHVRLDYLAATTLNMADPSDSGEVQKAAIAARAPEGTRPGVMAATSTSMVVTVVSYDRKSGLATFRTPDGLTRRAVVPPNLRSFAERRGPGSRVLVTMTEAVAATVTEAPKG